MTIGSRPKRYGPGPEPPEWFGIVVGAGAPVLTRRHMPHLCLGHRYPNPAVSKRSASGTSFRRSQILSQDSGRGSSTNKDDAHLIPGRPTNPRSERRGHPAVGALAVSGPHLVHEPLVPSVSSGASFAQVVARSCGDKAWCRTLIRIRSQIHGRPSAAITNTARRSYFPSSR
jgi:hypothetical protein